MKIHFNKFEKVAGLFVGLALGSAILGVMGLAIKNGWLERKVPFHTEVESADGIFPGTNVQIAGLRVGKVTSVELQGENKVQVGFEVLHKFTGKIRQDSRVQMFRPFILSDKVLEVSVGDLRLAEMEPDSHIPTEASFDVMDLLSGKKMTQAFASFDKLTESLRVVGEAFSDPERTKALVGVLDRIAPLVQNLNTMSVEIVKLTSVANKKQRAERIVQNLAMLSYEMQKMVPAFTKEVPNLGSQMGQLVNNLTVLTTEFQKLTPAISVIAPELPRTSRRAVEALDETVVLLKAMQRSFLLRGKVDEVREEEGRRPANTSEP